MTDSLEELDRMEREATDSPWEYDRDTGFIMHTEDAEDGYGSIAMEVYRENLDDVPFIVALRNRARELIDATKDRDHLKGIGDRCEARTQKGLAEIEALQAENQRLRDENIAVQNAIDEDVARLNKKNQRLLKELRYLRDRFGVGGERP